MQAMPQRSRIRREYVSRGLCGTCGRKKIYKTTGKCLKHYAIEALYIKFKRNVGLQNDIATACAHIVGEWVVEEGMRAYTTNKEPKGEPNDCSAEC